MAAKNQDGGQKLFTATTKKLRMVDIYHHTEYQICSQTCNNFSLFQPLDLGLTHKTYCLFSTSGSLKIPINTYLT